MIGPICPDDLSERNIEQIDPKMSIKFIGKSPLTPPGDDNSPFPPPILREGAGGGSAIPKEGKK
jgi:hypothetical protein